MLLSAHPVLIFWAFHIGWCFVLRRMEDVNLQYNTKSSVYIMILMFDAIVIL